MRGKQREMEGAKDSKREGEDREMEGKRKETHREGGSKQGKERGEAKKMKGKRGETHEERVGGNKRKEREKTGKWKEGHHIP